MHLICDFKPIGALGRSIDDIPLFGVTDKTIDRTHTSTGEVNPPGHHL
jgi:hypothetical protein